MEEILDEAGWNAYLADMVWRSLSSSSLKTKFGGQIHCRCPICGDSRKVSTKKRGVYYVSSASYYCFNCDVSMGGLSFLKAISPPAVYEEAVQAYKAYRLGSVLHSRRSAGPAEKDPLVKAPVPAWKILGKSGWKQPTRLTDEAVSYLERRGVAESARSSFLSIEDRTGFPFILIRYMYDGDCVFFQLHNFKGKSGVVKYIFPRVEDLNNQEKPPFNVDSVDPSWKYIVCCEGVYDSLMFKNGVSLGGRVLTSYQKELLKSRWPHHRLIMAFDNDGPGTAAMLKMCESGAGTMFLDVKKVLGSSKDANEFAVKNPDKAGLLKTPSFIEQKMMTPFEAIVKFGAVY